MAPKTLSILLIIVAVAASQNSDHLKVGNSWEYYFLKQATSTESGVWVMGQCRLTVLSRENHSDTCIISLMQFNVYDSINNLRHAINWPRSSPIDTLKNLVKRDTISLLYIRDSLWIAPGETSVVALPFFRYDFAISDIPLVVSSKNVVDQSRDSSLLINNHRVLLVSDSNATAFHYQRDTLYFLDTIGLIYSKHLNIIYGTINEIYCLTAFNNISFDINNYVSTVSTDTASILKKISLSISRRISAAPRYYQESSGDAYRFNLLGRSYPESNVSASNYQIRITEQMRSAGIRWNNRVHYK